MLYILHQRLTRLTCKATLPCLIRSINLITYTYISNSRMPTRIPLTDLHRLPNIDTYASKQSRPFKYTCDNSRSCVTTVFFLCHQFNTISVLFYRWKAKYAKYCYFTAILAPVMLNGLNDL